MTYHLNILIFTIIVIIFIIIVIIIVAIIFLVALSFTLIIIKMLLFSYLFYNAYSMEKSHLIYKLLMMLVFARTPLFVYLSAFKRYCQKKNDNDDNDDNECLFVAQHKSYFSSVYILFLFLLLFSKFCDPFASDIHLFPIFFFHPHTLIVIFLCIMISEKVFLV